MIALSEQESVTETIKAAAEIGVAVVVELHRPVRQLDVHLRPRLAVYGARVFQFGTVIFRWHLGHATIRPACSILTLPRCPHAQTTGNMPSFADRATGT